MARYNVIPSAAPAPGKVVPLRLAPIAPSGQDLVIGSRLTDGRGCECIVTGITGEQTPDTIEDLGGVVMGGSAEFDVVFVGESAHVHHRFPEAILRGYTLLPGLATAEEIAEALATAQRAGLAAEADRVQATADHESACAALPGRHPRLTPVVRSGGKSNPAAGAFNLKIELAEAFPGVRFSVKSETFSMGSAIRVGWCLGPTTKAVEAISQKYQQGNFNGQDDSYTYSGEAWHHVFGGAKYVTERRECETMLETLSRSLCDLRRVPYLGCNTRLHPGDPLDVQQHACDLVEQTTFPPGFESLPRPGRTRIERIEPATDPADARVNFRIVFTAPREAEPQPHCPVRVGPATLVASTHTKQHYPIWVVQLAERVDRAAYLKARELAHQLNGYYSNYKGNGAVPGFTFKEEAKARAFLVAVTGEPLIVAVAAPSDWPDETSPLEREPLTTSQAIGFNPIATPPPVKPAPVVKESFTTAGPRVAVQVPSGAIVSILAPIATTPPPAWRRRSLVRSL